MPNFPSLTSASQQHTDSPTDYLKDARAEINTTIGNVNSIITTFDGYTVTTTSEVQAYTKQQYATLNTLTDAASISWNLDDGQVSEVTLTANRALANPTNKQAGGTYILLVKQDATGSRTLSFGSEYKFSGGVTPSLTASANAVDIFTFISDGTYMYGVVARDF